MAPHPEYPQSNVSKFSGYDSDKYVLEDVTLTSRTNEDLTPGRPPCLTQQTVGKYLQPLTRALVEVPPRPTIDELPDTVIDKMVQKDKAFWVDKPGANAYTLHDAYYNYGMTTDMVKPTHQDVFPRSYQYDLDCVKYRRRHACDGLKEHINKNNVSLKPLGPDCRPCGKKGSFVESSQESEQKRWRNYPDLTATLTTNEIRTMMDEVGRPFQNEACNWYYQNYPSEKYDCIMRKFSK